MFKKDLKDLLPISGLSYPVGNCDAGFYCPGGNTVPNPVATLCPIGLHCPTGSAMPQPCLPGYFTNFSQAADCLECIAGFYCVPEEVIAGNPCQLLFKKTSWLLVSVSAVDTNHIY